MTCKPERYDGTIGKCETFLINFDNVAYANKWDKRQKLNYLRSNLTGEAVHILSEHNREDWTYKLLVESLKLAFGTKQSETQLLASLVAQRQQPGQTVAAYRTAVMRIIAKLPRGSYSENTNKELFIKGLRDKTIRRHLKNARPKSLEKAALIAIDQEEITNELNEAPAAQVSFNDLSKKKPNNRRSKNSSSTFERNRDSYNAYLPKEEAPSKPQELETNQQPGSQDVRDYLRDDYRANNPTGQGDQRGGFSRGRFSPRRNRKGGRGYSNNYQANNDNLFPRQENPGREAMNTDSANANHNASNDRAVNNQSQSPYQKARNENGQFKNQRYESK